MMNGKMTQRDYFNEIITLASANGRQDIVDFAEDRIAMLDRKAGTRKPTKTQVENEGYKAELATVLTAEGATVTEIMGRSTTLSALSNQRVSALLRLMIAEGKVVKTVEGKKSLFALA